MQNRLTIEELSNKLKPLFGKKIDELYFRYSVSNSLEEKSEILQILTTLYQKHLNKLLDKKILLEPPTKELIGAEYSLAKVSYAGKNLYDFGLREKDWPRHVCISGMSGSGKTTFAINILKSFIEKNKPFLVFDWKSSFRPLMKIDNDIMILTVGNDSVSNLFKLNINCPPKGIDPKEWINTLCDLLTESFSASFGVHKILLETLNEVFEGWGIYEGQKHYPNWQHVKKMLEIKSKDVKGREAGWYESALRIASVLTFGSFGKVVNYDGKKSLSIEDLFNKKIILELNSLSNIEKKFFSEYILTYIYKLKKSSTNSINSGFQYAILVDEAHNVFLKKQTNFLSESVTDLVYREMREYGISLICLDQHISKLSDTVTGNSACHVAFQQQLPADIETISSLMQLKERKEGFSQLQVGSAIAKLSERYTHPFLINVPQSNLREIIISDEDIKSRATAIIDGITIEKNEPEFFQDLVNPPVTEKIKGVPIIQKRIINEPVSEAIQLKEPIKLSNLLTKAQEILFNFSKEKLKEGFSLKEIENLLEKGLHENLYRQNDILLVINLLMNEKLKESYFDHENSKNMDQSTLQKKTLVEEINIKDKEQNIDYSKLNKEEIVFVEYLKNNPFHKNSTVELYEKIGVSSRKGNIIKNKLIEKNLLKIDEEKYEKGWRKYIRLK